MKTKQSVSKIHSILKDNLGLRNLKYFALLGVSTEYNRGNLTKEEGLELQEKIKSFFTELKKELIK